MFSLYIRRRSFFSLLEGCLCHRAVGGKLTFLKKLKRMSWGKSSDSSIVKSILHCQFKKTKFLAFGPHCGSNHPESAADMVHVIIFKEECFRLNYSLVALGAQETNQHFCQTVVSECLRSQQDII